MHPLRILPWLCFFSCAALLHAKPPTDEAIDQLCQECVAIQTKLGEILESITDKKSFEAAEPEFDALAQRAKDLVAAGEQTGFGTWDQAVQIDTKYANQQFSAVRDALPHVKRVSSLPEVGEALDQRLQEIRKHFANYTGPLPRMFTSGTRADMFSTFKAEKLKVNPAYAGKKFTSWAAKQGEITSLTISPGGTRCATYGRLCIKVWNAMSGHPEFVLRGLPNSIAHGDVNWMQFSRDEKTLFVGTEDGALWEWDLATEKVKPWFRVPCPPFQNVATAVNHREDRFVIATAQRLWSLDRTTGVLRSVKNVPQDNKFVHLEFSPDDRLLVGVQRVSIEIKDDDQEERFFSFIKDYEYKSRITVWDVADGMKTLWTQETNELEGVTITSDSKQLYTYCYADRELRTRDLKNGEVVQRVFLEAYGARYHFNTDRTLMLGVGMQEIPIYELPSGQGVGGFANEVGLEAPEFTVADISSEAKLVIMADDDGRLFRRHLGKYQFVPNSEDDEDLDGSDLPNIDAPKID